MKHILLTIILLVIFSAPSFACGVFGSIYGNVASQTAAGYLGINQARVMLSADGVLLRTGWTNPFGFYAFWNVPACNMYTVSVASRGRSFIEPIQLVVMPVPDTDNNFEVDFISNYSVLYRSFR